MTAALFAMQLNPRNVNGRIYFGSRNEYVSPTTGSVNLTAGTDVNTIKRSYAAEVVKSQAKRNGWTLKQTGPFQYSAQKRI